MTLRTPRAVVPMKLQNCVRRYRFEHGEMTQQQLATAVGVTRQTIHSIETGKFVPSTVLALKIARTFQQPVENIFSLGEDQKNKEGE